MSGDAGRLGVTLLLFGVLYLFFFFIPSASCTISYYLSAVYNYLTVHLNHKENTMSKKKCACGSDAQLNNGMCYHCDLLYKELAGDPLPIGCLVTTVIFITVSVIVILSLL